MSKSKLQSFKDQFVAFVKGDDEGVLAEKVYRQKQAGLTSHISSYEGDIVDLEVKVEEAEENLVKARLNYGILITNRSNYVLQLVNAKNALEDAKEKLEDKKDVIKFLKEELGK